MKNRVDFFKWPLLGLSVLSLAFSVTALIMDKTGPQGEIGLTGQNGADGNTPYIGENGDWWIGSTDTHISATGDKGDKGDTGAAGSTGSAGQNGADGSTPYIGENGNWWIGSTDTHISATGAKGDKGDKGDTGATGSTGSAGQNGSDGNTPYIGENGNWWIGTTDTGVRVTPYTYVVTFNPDNGDASFTQDVIENKKAVKPADPVKPGYTFHGWYADTNELWVFAGYSVTENMTLTAQYTPIVYTVTLDVAGGFLSGSTSLQIQYDAQYTLPTPTQTGYLFGGWEDENGNTVPLSGTYTYLTNLDLTAKWNPLYTVSFDSNGGSAVASIDKYDYNPIDALPVPTKDGAIFDGWYLGSNKVEAPFTPSGYTSVCLVAKWILVEGDFTYRKINSDSEVEIISYIGTSAAMAIPDDILGLPVTSIADKAFLNNTTITNVDFGSNVKAIGYSAFMNCSSLISIVIPDGITQIQTSQFKGCSSLVSIILPNTITMIQNEAFRGCSSLASIVLPNGVTSISYYAFMDCSSLESINIPSTVTYISFNVFVRCKKITSIIIPLSVTTIGSGAFNDCTALTTIYCEAASKPNGWDLNWNYGNVPVVWGYHA